MSTPPLLTTPEITRLHSYFLHTQLHAETQNLATTPPNPETTPLAHFLTKNVLHTFPFTRGKPEFWEKIWEFVAQVKKRRFSTSAERQEATLRKLWTEKYASLAATALAMGINTGQDTSDEMKDLLENIAKTQAEAKEAVAKTETDDGTPKARAKTLWKPRVLITRTVISHGMLRNSTSTSYVILATDPESGKDYLTSHTWNELKKLKKDIITELPHELSVIFPDLTPHPTDKHQVRPCALLGRWLNDQTESQALKAFLTDPAALTTMTEADNKAIEISNASTQARHQITQDFRNVAAIADQKLRSRETSITSKLLKPGGVAGIFTVFEQIPNIQDLPPEYTDAMEWARIRLAWTIYSLFVDCDEAPSYLHGLRRSHGLMPYRVMGTILKYTNPLRIMKAFMDLFLAQPFGSRSLMQRIAMASLQDEITEMQKDIHACQKEIADDDVCLKIKNYILTGDRIHAPPGTEFATILLQILRNDTIEPVLPHTKIDSIEANEGEIQIPLFRLMLLETHKCDKEEIGSLVFEGVTGQLFKEAFSIFYMPLLEVYNASDLSKMVMCMRNFITDLIALLDKIYADSKTDPVNGLLNLIHSYEEEWYGFIHNLYQMKGRNVIKEVVDWCESVADFFRTEGKQKTDLRAWFAARNIDMTHDLQILEAREAERIQREEEVKEATANIETIEDARNAMQYKLNAKWSGSQLLETELDCLPSMQHDFIDFIVGEMNRNYDNSISAQASTAAISR